jgi:hypothetical protein
MKRSNTKHKELIWVKGLIETCDRNIMGSVRPIAKQYHKRMKACIICFFNKDKVGLENWTTKLKTSGRKYIDEMEADCDTLKYIIYDGEDRSSNHEHFTREGAYNEMCRNIKEEIEGVDRLVLYI